MVDAPQAVNIYQAIGGDPTVRRLARRFYQLMDELPESYGVRRMHPADLASSEQTLYEYLTGWLGGPPLYVQRNGHPRLRQRHLPYAIGPQERSQWMLCMRLALAEVVEDSALREGLTLAFDRLADHMMNMPLPAPARSDADPSHPLSRRSSHEA